jgi:hypothetical protein
MKDSAHHLRTYFEGIWRLTYPRELLSLAILESDSADGTHELLAAPLGNIGRFVRRANLFKHDFGYRLPAGTPRYAGHVQMQRRSILAKSRNHLLFRALRDEDWVLWLDCDVIEYAPDIVERLIATGKDIVHPNCVLEYGGRSFDLNAWREGGSLHLHDLREEGDLVALDSVGGTMLLVRADAHRDGLIFPPFAYGLRNPKIREQNEWIGELETEGLGIMASDMGLQCWGMPNLEIKHHPS